MLRRQRSDLRKVVRLPSVVVVIPSESPFKYLLPVMRNSYEGSSIPFGGDIVIRTGLFRWPLVGIMNIC